MRQAVPSRARRQRRLRSGWASSRLVPRWLWRRQALRLHAHVVAVRLRCGTMYAHGKRVLQEKPRRQISMNWRARSELEAGTGLPTVRQASSSVPSRSTSGDGQRQGAMHDFSQGANRALSSLERAAQLTPPPALQAIREGLAARIEQLQSAVPIRAHTEVLQHADLVNLPNLSNSSASTKCIILLNSAVPHVATTRTVHAKEPPNEPLPLEPGDRCCPGCYTDLHRGAADGSCDLCGVPRDHERGWMWTCSGCGAKLCWGCPVTIRQPELSATQPPTPTDYEEETQSQAPGRPRSTHAPCDHCGRARKAKPATRADNRRGCNHCPAGLVNREWC